MKQMQNKKCGYVALLGQPNAGKSTLMNACLGTKLAVVSAKPQTTRNRILGVCPTGDTQILFLDTPGIHKTAGLPKLNVKMTATAWSVVGDADLVCYLVDSIDGWAAEDSIFFKKLLATSSVPVIVVATKIDKAKSEIVEKNVMEIAAQINSCVDEVIAQLSSSAVDGAEVKVNLLSRIPMLISAKRPADVVNFRQFVSEQMPVSPWLYSADDLTDRPQQFVCGELIREQLFRQLGQELPYSAAIKVERFENKGRLTVIQASVIVHKDNHKAMVIGARGARIKSIGQAARESLEKHLERQVHLELFVKVQSNWIDSDNLLAEYAGLEKWEE
jgi:GTP-binding protein Era